MLNCKSFHLIHFFKNEKIFFYFLCMAHNVCLHYLWSCIWYCDISGISVIMFMIMTVNCYMLFMLYMLYVNITYAICYFSYCYILKGEVCHFSDKWNCKNNGYCHTQITRKLACFPLLFWSKSVVLVGILKLLV